MNNIFRGLIAGYGAHKLGGGCLSTILIFIVIWVLLGQCGAAMPPRPEPEVAKATVTHPLLLEQGHAVAVPLTADPATLPARWP
jgi:hypothetical protein